MNLSAKRKQFLKEFFGQDPDMILEALSSSYCEQQDRDFRESFGLNMREGREAMEAFIWHINHL